MKWIKENSLMLKVFAIYSIFTFLFTAYFITLVAENVNGLEQYAQTKIITKDLTQLSLVGIFNFLLAGIWTIYLIFIIFKLLFPKKNSFKNAFFFEELVFLKELPKKVKGEIDLE